jgi:hypothetical protein
MPFIIDFTHLSRTGVVIHKVSNIRSYTKIMFSSQLLGVELGVTQYRNNVDIKIKLIIYDPNGGPWFFFLNSATWSNIRSYTKIMFSSQLLGVELLGLVEIKN